MGVTVLGELSAGGRPLSGPIERRLLCCLVAHRFHPIEADLLIDAAWGEAPPTRATPALQTRLSRLREALGPGSLRWSGRAYVVDLADDQLDVARFERAVAEARSLGEPAERLAGLDAALGLWRGEPFAELSSEGFARPEAVRLAALRDEAVHRRLTTLHELGRHAEVVAGCRSLLDDEDQSDAPVALLARALAATGRSREALVALAEHRHRLIDQAGLEPGPLVTDAERDILAGRVEAAAAPAEAVIGVVGVPPDDSVEWRGTVQVVPPFVGREGELRLLHRLLDDAARGLPAVVEVAGPAGVGKSRLVDEALARAGRGRVVASACHEGVALPFEPIDRLLAQLGRGVPDAPPSPLAASDHDLQRVEFEARRQALQRAELLLDAARSAPLVMLIDDVHWADEGTSATLQAASDLVGAAARTGPLPLALLVTRRTADGPAPAAAPGRHRTLVELRPFSRVETAALIEASTGARAAPELADAAAVHSGGNALAVVTGLRGLHRDRLLRLRAGQLTTTDGGGAFDADVSPAVAAVLARLDPTHRQLLAAVALLRPGSTPDEAARLLGVELDDLLDAIEAVDRHGMLTVRGGRLHFPHPSYRSALCASSTGTAQRRTHQGIARRLAQPATDAEALVMAWHLSHAELAASGRHRHLFLRAADHCFASCDWFEATRYYRHALGHDVLVASASVIRAGLAAFRAHDPAQAVEWFEAGASAARSAGDVELWASAVACLQRSRLTTVGLGAVDVAELVRVAEALDGRDAARHAEVCALLAEVAYAARDVEAGRHWIRRARRASGSGAGPSTVATVEFAGGLLALGELDLGEARDRFARCDSAAAAAGEPWTQSWARCRLALAELLAGDVAGARARVVEARAVAEVAGAWADLAVALTVEASALAATGDCEAAVVTATEAVLVWRRSRYPFVVHLLFPLLAHCRLALGDPDEALRVLDRWAGTGSRGHAAWRPLVLAEAGHLDAARAAVAERPPLPPGEPGEVLFGTAHRPVIAALVARRLDLPDLADQARASLLQLDERGVAVTPGWPVPIRRLLEPDDDRAGRRAPGGPERWRPTDAPRSIPSATSHEAEPLREAVNQQSPQPGRAGLGGTDRPAPRP